MHCHFMSASHRNQPKGTTQSLQSPDRPGSKCSFIKQVTLGSWLKLGWSHDQGAVNLRLSRPQPCLQFWNQSFFTCFHVFCIDHLQVKAVKRAARRKPQIFRVKQRPQDLHEVPQEHNNFRFEFFRKARRVLQKL